MARKAGYKRVTYYSHIKKKSLAIAILQKYAKAIKHDFSADIPEMNEVIIEDPSSLYSNEPHTMEEAIEQRNLWRDKFYALMDKYVSMIEKKKPEIAE